jgi:oligosaccharide amylase
MEKYFNDAIIGNKRLRAGFTKRGELIRLFYPNIDFKQFIEEFKVGIKINDSNIIHLEEDINNVYNQFYSEGANVLNTEIINTYFNLHIMQTDCAPIEMNNLLIRKYKMINKNTIPLDIKIIIKSKLLTDENNEVASKVIDNGIIQYTHDYSFSIFSQLELLSHKIHNPDEVIEKAEFYDKDYIGMSNNSAIIYQIKTLAPNEMIEFPILIYVNDNNEKYKIMDIEKEIENITKKDLKSEITKTKKYWRKYLKEHSKIDFKSNENKIKNIYDRTILLFPLLTNEETGGIAATMEIDEKKTKCGRYAYSWPRDAVFITRAFELLDMNKETEKFYTTFCKNTQSKNGMWEQRFYTDGRLASGWGYQIDETASVVYGVYNHYLTTNNFKFLKDNFKMIEKATTYLQKYVEKIIKNERIYPESYDLWEMHEGISLYSLASIYGAFEAMIQINDKMEYEYINNRLRQNEIREQKELLQDLIIKLKEFIVNNFYDEENKNYRRNLEDRKLDLSILGTVYPFKVFKPNEKKVQNTVERINMTLRTYTGGYLRFEDDHYTQDRPWVISTLWMALYYLESGKRELAKECFEFVVKTQNKHGLLAEQINNYTMEPAWVIGLGWSHAMFILVLEELKKNSNDLSTELY